jgi:glycogen operon protein
MRALLATLFASTGTIMLTAGDEFGRSQQGNNNAYCQDSAIGWVDWSGRDEALEDYVAHCRPSAGRGITRNFRVLGDGCGPMARRCRPMTGKRRGRAMSPMFRMTPTRLREFCIDRENRRVEIL